MWNMSPEGTRKPAQAIEISTVLAGRRVGLCGFRADESNALTNALRSVGVQVLLLDDRLIAHTESICDAIVVKLLGTSPDVLPGVVYSGVPTLVVCPGELMLSGANAAYSWADDFLPESWSKAELFVRIFRLLQVTRVSRSAAELAARREPLVLLADDDPDLTTLVEAILRSDGINSRIAGDGLEALRLMRELSPDLMVLDVRMPAMDGFAVLQTIRIDPSLETLPVILLTGCDNPDDVALGAELKASDYIRKPVSPSGLLVRVRRLLAAHVNHSKRWVRVSHGNQYASPGTVQRRWIQQTASPGMAGSAL